jgi:hypothetical protein
MRGFAVGVALVVTLGLGMPAVAQEACTGSELTVEGKEFSGSGGSISEPITLKEGVVFADITMGEAGSVKLLNAAGDSILLGNKPDAYTNKSAEPIREAGDYYLVIEFYSTDADWSVTLQQPES